MAQFSGVDTVMLARAATGPQVTLPAYAARVERIITPFLQPRDCGLEPIRLPVDWSGLPRTDGVEVAPTTLTIGPPASGADPVSLGELISRLDGHNLIVDVPAGRRIRKLNISGLVALDTGRSLRDVADLEGRRLAITAADPNGQFVAPSVAVPPERARGQVSPVLTGGSFSGRVLTLPDLAGKKLRISLVTGGTPDEFSTVQIAAGTVTGWAAPIPRDIEITAPNGAMLWSFPGEFLPGTPPATVDLTVGIQGAFDAQFSAGLPLAGDVSIMSKTPGQIGLALPTVRGSLLRSVRGTTRTTLAGGPVRVSVAGEELPDAAPTSAVADVHVSYDGIRLAEISDLLPASRATEGVVVGTDPVTRSLPPQALRGALVAKVGLVGRATIRSEMTVRLLDNSPGAGDEPLSPPAVITVEPSTAGDGAEVSWVTFDPPIVIDRPTAVSLTVTKGTFLWVADPLPRVRIAVVDPDPGGRSILLADQALLTLDTSDLLVHRAALPGAAFTGAGGGQLVFASALFCTVELTDLTLRYARTAQGG